MDVGRGMKSACAQCGGPLASGAAACKRCGTIATDSGDPQYGLLDLEAGEAGASLALDTSVEPTPPRRAQPRPEKARARTQSSQRMDAVNPARSGARTVAEGGSAQGGSARSATGASSARNRAMTDATVQQQRKATIGGNPTAPNPAAARPAKKSVGKMRAATVNDGLADSVADPASAAVPYGRGMMLDDDPLNNQFGSNGGNAAALELEHVDENDDIAPSAPPEPVETSEQQRARQIKELAGYGVAPTSVVAEPSYWVRVMLRKRALETELLALAAQRKRADDGTNEALTVMGQALRALGDDERLAKLRKLLAAVAEADTRIGAAEAQGAKKKQGVHQELARLDRDLAKLEQKASPLRGREAKLLEELEQIDGSLKRADLLRKKAEAELEALQRKGGGDVETWGALKAERDARHGEVQSLGIQMRPLQDDLAVLRKELAQQMRAIEVVQSEKQGASTSLERAQQSHRMATGSARGALQQALASLANAAFKAGLDTLVADEAAAVVEARERAQEKRTNEELMRAAATSYDHAAYSRGMMILCGGTGLFFLALVIAILF
jgi:hypothetical protein